MKTILLTLLIPVLAIVTRQHISFLNSLDFSGGDYDINWDDITDDLWP